MEIHENNTNHLKEFIQLNEAWISKYFQIEQSDIELANNPSIIIDNGGYILSLVANNKVVGVCALFNDGQGVYELARMAVAENHQGKGYAKALINKSIKKAKELQANKLYLISNTKLKPAIALYKKYGFKTVRTGQHPVYSRANIEMQYENT